MLTGREAFRYRTLRKPSLLVSVSCPVHFIGHWEQNVVAEPTAELHVERMTSCLETRLPENIDGSGSPERLHGGSRKKGSKGSKASWAPHAVLVFISPSIPFQ